MPLNELIFRFHFVRMGGRGDQVAKDSVRVGEGVIKWLRTLSEWEEKGEQVAKDAYFLP